MTISISIPMTIAMTKIGTIPNSMTMTIYMAMTRTVIVLLLLLGGGRGDKRRCGPPRLGRQTPA
jgi:hypothetical protein